METMPQPTWRDVMFSVKTFGAAMLALYIAFLLNLTQPSWAMLTALIVAQPIAGMVAAKSLFRVVGTVIGASVALALVGAFAQSPPLFLAALALWIGLCTATSVLLRDAPGAYGAMLSGYTAAIIGIPAALAPDTAFDYALGRCLEILLGIGCATIVSHIVFPRTAGTALQGSVDTTLGAAATWAGDVLRGESQDEKALADQRRMIADVIALDALRIFATFDTPAIRTAGDVARHLQGQLIGFLSLLVSITDRLTLLRDHAPGKQERVQDLLREAAALLDRDNPLQPHPDMRAEITRIQAEAARRLPSFEDMVRDHETILIRNILLRLSDIVGRWQTILDLRDSLSSGRPMSMPQAAPSAARYRDYTLALVAGATSTAAVSATSVLWITSDWAQGSSAVIFSGVICSILASLDNPAPAAENFMRMTLISAVLAAIYMFGILPGLDDFASLTVALLPFYLPFGILLALPRIGLQVTPLGLNVVALLGLSNTPSQPDLATFLNSTIALVAGIGAGILSFRLLRPLGVEWTVRRIRSGVLNDLERLALPGAVNRDRFASRMFDRINALFTRLDVSDEEQRAMMRSTLAALRIGFNILLLRSARNGLPQNTAQAVDKALSALAIHFRELGSNRRGAGSVRELDQAVATLLEHPSERADDVLTALVAIGSALHRHSDFFGVNRPSPLPEALRPEALA
jgi:uncharacterized membrane protein YccC